MEITILEEEIRQLRNELMLKENQLLKLKERQQIIFDEKDNVPRWAIERYSRQSLLSELGSPKDAILKLMRSSVLIVGAGGLGCPAALYLAGSGIGHIGIVDYDEVELTNLHRQPLHSELTLGMTKVESAVLTLKRMNSNITVTPFNCLLNSKNALPIIEKYDVVIDATDNAVTRYLLNDACVITKKPLISAAALQLSGQFTVYNHTIYSACGDKTMEIGPCYRCIFPVPPPPEMMGSCSQNGVLGPVPGVMGCLQAIEAVKIILGKPSIAGQLLLFDGSDCSFRKVKLRPKNKNCAVCSESPTITELIDYEKFCNSKPSDKDLKLDILKPEERISAECFHKNVYQNINQKIPNPVVLIDVRTNGEYNMCKIDNSINHPIDVINYDNLAQELSDTQEIYFVCRRGNDSQIAAQQLKKLWPKHSKIPIIKDIEGGLHAWARTVDSNFPIY